MARSLILLPLDGDTFSHTVLRCVSDATLFEEIATLPAFRVPPDFASYVARTDDPEVPTHYGPTPVDAYGHPLRMVEAEALVLGVGHLPGVQSHSRNRAIWAYVGALEPGTRVALFWS